MIPRLGRILPYGVAILGVFDTLYLWSGYPYASAFIGLVTLYLIHLMCRNHRAIVPKDALFYLIAPAVLIVIILVATYCIFF